MLSPNTSLISISSCLRSENKSHAIQDRTESNLTKVLVHLVGWDTSKSPCYREISHHHRDILWSLVIICFRCFKDENIFQGRETNKKALAV